MHAVEMGEQTHGSRPVFVLVHGLGMSNRYMMPTAELLSVLGKVYAPDLPGFGKSGKPSHIPTISELADSLAEWMAAVGINSPVLIGNSMGAQVIVDFAVRHRTRLTAAVLVGATIDPEARRMSTQIRRLLTDVPREPLALYGIAMTDYFRAGVGRCLQTLRHALNDPIAEKLPALRVPVLIVRGERDPIVPQRWTERAAGLAPDASCVIIPGAAHAVNYSAPEALVKEVMKFMERA
jgi:2-hydroxy-6-oxonona-2,4-dienedioate hydrolase